MLMCPWARYLTPNCSWWLHFCMCFTSMLKSYLIISCSNNAKWYNIHTHNQACADKHTHHRGDNDGDLCGNPLNLMTQSLHTQTANTHSSNTIETCKGRMSCSPYWGLITLDKVTPHTNHCIITYYTVIIISSLLYSWSSAKQVWNYSTFMQPTFQSTLHTVDRCYVQMFMCLIWKYYKPLVKVKYSSKYVVV